MKYESICWFAKLNYSNDYNVIWHTACCYRERMHGCGNKCTINAKLT